MTGQWLRENDQEGHVTYENWLKKSDTEYNGEGFTLRNNDTVFSEKMRLIKLNSIWNLEITGADKKPMLFVFINQTNYSFICENKENDFPKKIQYTKDNETLVAKISNDTLEIPFQFKKR
jgi:hypothetical protein